MKTKIDRRGLAILTTLLILSLLLALIAAFLVVNRAGNRFTLNSVERRQAQDICMTAFNYAWYKLEENRNWGDGSVAVEETVQYPYGSPQVKLEQVQGTGVLTVNGRYSPGGNFDQPLGTFTMTVENNLQSRNAGDGVKGPVPARSVRIEVVAEIGTVSRTLAALLRPEPQSHDSLAAGRNVNLDDTAGLVRIESRDPYVNRLRAGEDLNLPFEDNVQFLKHGVGASSAELNVGGTNLAQAPDDVVRDAGEASGGVYMPNASAPEIKPFDPSEIALPNLSSSIAAGTWTFGDITHVEYIPHNVQYDEPPPPGSPAGTRGNQGHVRRYQKKSSRYNQLTSPTSQVWVAGQAIEGTEELDPDYDPPVYDSESGAESYGYSEPEPSPVTPGQDVHQIAPGFKANVTTAQMVVAPEYALQVPGDFIVEAVGNRLPEMYFGYDFTVGGVAEQQSLKDGLEAAQDDPSKYMAGIVADGDVNVTGGVLGYGSMLAGGDLTIKASSGLRTAPELGVVVKGRNLIINPATEPEPTIPGEPVDVDYPIFRDAIQAESDGDWSQYNAWLDHNQETRREVIDSLKATSTGSTAATLWNTLCSELGETFPPPNFDAYDWGSGPVSVDQYVRMKEFLQTRASYYNDGAGDPTWLELDKRQDDSAGRVGGILNGIAQWARSYKQSFQQYLTNPDQGPPDMYLEGLIYAEEDLLVNATDKSVRLEGAVVAQNGDITITAPTRVDLVYNRGLLDDLFSGDGTGALKLEKVFFTLE